MMKQVISTGVNTTQQPSMFDVPKKRIKHNSTLENYPIMKTPVIGSVDLKKPPQTKKTDELDWFKSRNSIENMTNP